MSFGPINNQKRVHKQEVPEAEEEKGNLGFSTPSNLNTGQNTQKKSIVKKLEPVEVDENLEIDKSRRRLNFVDIEPEPADQLAEKERKEVDFALDDLLENVAAPTNSRHNSPMKNEKVKVQEFPLGTPGSVLGIHQKNAYAKKPRNQKERIEMKQLNGKSTNTKSHKKLPNPKRTVSRSKDLAPNGIKKISSTAKLTKVASRK